MPDRKLNILFYSPSKVWAGAESQLSMLLAELIEQGVQPLLAAPSRSPLAEEARKIGVEVLGAPPHTAPYRSPLGFRRLVKWFEKTLRQRRIDIVHVNGFWASRAPSWAVFGPSTGATGRSGRKLPTLVIAHIRECDPTKTREIRMTSRLFPVDHYVAVADHVKTFFESLTPTPVRRIYNGIRVDRFDPNALDVPTARGDLNLTADVFAVGMAARIHPCKGHKVLLDACHLLAQEDIPIKLFLAGSPLTAMDEDYYSDLRRWTKDNRFDKFAVWMGFVKDMASFYRAMDVMAVPSAPTREAGDVEAFSNVILEAMAMESCLVASNVGGAKEAIEPSRSGYLVAPRDGAALAARLEELYHHPERREMTGRNARNRVKEFYSIERCAEELRRLYRDMSGLSRKVEAWAEGEG